MVFWKKKSAAAAPEPETETKAADKEAAVEDGGENTEEGAGESGGWLSRLRGGLARSSAKLGQDIADLVTKRRLDQEMLDQLEEALITSDLGPRTAAKIVAAFGEGRFGKDIDDAEVRAALSESVAAILAPVAKPFVFARPEEGGPQVILVCGVNGAGKTTTIGKLAYKLAKEEGKKVAIAAGDTFRAAAIEQLRVWAERAGAPLIAKDIGADAAAVAYEAYETAVAEDSDVLFIDTAGRLHNKANLMAELEKIVRVLKKRNDRLPHAVLLVLDATTGQNAIEQVRVFREMLNVTGLAVTKLDGSARGGVVVALADLYGLPVHMIGVGEKVGDLQPFEAEAFARSLTGLE
jgi:fused signal recognition particle receptor